MRIVMLGPPASGKGTQAAMIGEKLNIPSVSTGALLREEKARDTELGRETDGLIREGRMVPDDLMNHIVETWLTEAKPTSFILDGYPRSVAQGEAFEGMLADRGLPLDIVLFLDLSVETIRRRVSGRMVCEKCGYVVNVGLHVETDKDPCPACGGTLARRNDDNLDALTLRLEEYREKTEPLVGFYTKRGLLSHIVGEGHPKPVFQQIEEALGLHV